ncbi:hypothetical protein [Sorangium sp. So ce131]|uniref:hypothetical protein n=1 Tax=Sorangium sp. So ce131 TaxID=3133282 RepID=UPI003F6210AA
MRDTGSLKRKREPDNDETSLQIARVLLSLSASTELGSTSGTTTPCANIRSFAASPRPHSPRTRTEAAPLTSDEQFDQEKFIAAFSEHLASQKNDDEEAGRAIVHGAEALVGERRPSGKDQARKKAKNSRWAACSDDERDLVRLTWVLEKLDPRRVCVAALLTANNHVYLYANVIDEERFKRDLADLVEASSNPEMRKRISNQVIESLGKQDRTAQGRRDTAEYEKKVEERTALATRRVDKALRLLEKLELNKDDFRIHVAETESKHAEMRAGDAAVENAGGFVGISKLCCGKCRMGLLALEKSRRIRFSVQGAHYKTYDTQTGWPVPAFLHCDEEAMKAFLGDEAFAMYQKHPDEALRAVASEKLKAPAYAATDMVSSGEEYGEGEAEDDDD